MPAVTFTQVVLLNHYGMLQMTMHNGMCGCCTHSTRYLRLLQLLRSYLPLRQQPPLVLGLSSALLRHRILQLSLQAAQLLLVPALRLLQLPLQRPHPCSAVSLLLLVSSISLLQLVVDAANLLPVQILRRQRQQGSKSAVPHVCSLARFWEYIPATDRAES
jgi:hypothetical protein